MTFTLETHSVNGAVYETGPFPTEEAAREAAGKPAPRESYWQWFTRDGDRRVSRSMPGARRRHHWLPVSAEAEDERLALIAEHGPHPFTYGNYPNDGNRCLVCGATRLHSAHDRQTPRFLQPWEIER